MIIIGSLYPSCSATSTFALDASTDAYAATFLADKAGTITDIGFCINAITGASPTYDFRLETIDSAGLPTNTLATTGSNVTGTLAAGFSWKTLATPHIATLGQHLAAVIRYSSGTINASNLATVNTALTAGTSGNCTNNSPNCYTSTGSWTAVAGYPYFGVKYQDGSIQYGCYAANSAMAITTYNSSSGTNRRGIAFIAPFDFYCFGMRSPVRQESNSSTFDFRLYESTTQLASISIPGTATRSTAALVVTQGIFSTPIRLKRGTTYRAVVVPTSANNIRVLNHSFNGSPEREALIGENYLTTWNGSAWVDDTTDGFPLELFGNFTDYITGRQPRMRYNNV